MWNQKQTLQKSKPTPPQKYCASPVPYHLPATDMPSAPDIKRPMTLIFERDLLLLMGFY